MAERIVSLLPSATEILFFCGVGDRVLLMETQPLSSSKRWRVVEVIEKAKEPAVATGWLPSKPA